MKAKLSVFLLVLVACSESAEERVADTNASKEILYPSEIIDGPANIRDSPNGKLIFELDDEVYVEIADKDDRDEWYRIGVWVYNVDIDNFTLHAGLELLDYKQDKIGKVLSDEISSYYGMNDAYYFEGYTHEGNIKEESIVEKAFVNFINDNGRGESEFEEFINNYGLFDKAEHLNFNGPYLYENFITDPSPGYRLMLLFEDGLLQGFYHSRTILLEDVKTYELWRNNDRVSFFKDYPEAKQLEFVSHMNEWLKRVD